MNRLPLLVLQRSDLNHIARNPARFEGTRLLFVDPGLLDEAAVRGLQDHEFRRIDVGPDLQARAASEAMARATLLDLQLTQERERLWPTHASLHGWDVGVFFLALQRAAVARQIGALVAASFPEPRLNVLRPSVPQQMYFDSFVGPDLVAADPARFCVLDVYTEARWHRDDAYTQVFDAAAISALMRSGLVNAVTHVPTCFYDRAWLADEVSRAFSHTLDLASPFWDVPLHRGAQLQMPRTALPHDPAVAAYREQALQVLDATLGDLLPQPVARRAQVLAWADRCAWQAANHTALLQGLAGTRPHVVLSDQDTGCNGPLFSVADALGAPVTVVPHSGHPSMLLPHARRVTAVEQAGYGTQPRTVLGQNVAVRTVRYAPRPELLEAPRVRSLCLMLNSMQTEGLSHVDAHALAAFHRPLAALCAAHDVHLILRAKPGAPALSVLAGALGLPPQQLVQDATESLPRLAERAQLCIAYGEPTTGVAPFLAVGALVLQVCPQRWPTDYTVCMPLVQDGVIPLLDHEQALLLVSDLLARPDFFQSRRQTQRHAFDARCEGAHDHLF
jgi:hypothetical protein